MSHKSAATAGSAPFDLSDYGIVIDTVSAVDFFGHEPAAPLAELSDFLTWNIGDSCDGFDEKSDLLAAYLDVALYKASQPGPAGCYYLIELLPALGFTSTGGIVAIPRELALTVNNTTTKIKADMTLTHSRAPNTVILVAKEDQTAFGEPDPEPLLVAAAIAAFQDTQRYRAKQDLSPVTYVEYPGLVMNGTRPSFYKIPVSAALNAAVAAGQPNVQHSTRVTKCDVPSQQPGETMENREYRRRALQYMDAFRSLSVDLWQKSSSMPAIAKRQS